MNILKCDFANLIFGNLRLKAVTNLWPLKISNTHVMAGISLHTTVFCTHKGCSHHGLGIYLLRKVLIIGLWLRMDAAFAEDLNLIPSTHLRSTQLFVILGPGDPMLSFVLCENCIHTYKHIHT